MENSILKTIKKLLGLSADYTVFDEDILIHINTVFSNMAQMGIVSEEGFYIEDDTALWSDYFEEDENKEIIQQIKTYIYLKVRLYFDPPANSNLLQAYEKHINELEIRLYTLKGGY